jgi:4'-phosphopantetheinyl transferase EntD
MSNSPSPLRIRPPLARLLQDKRIAVAEMDPRLVGFESLFAEETAAIANAVLVRRQHFAAGRVLARQALAALGQAPVALPSDPQRVPVWPAGFVGSITHTRDWCAVAVARSVDIQALGADVERATALERDLWDRVCRPEEREFLSRHAPDEAGRIAKAVFSAKESIYKALYPTIRQFLDFQGMRIELSQTETEDIWCFEPVLMTAWGGFDRGHRFGQGKLELGPELVVSAIAW